MLFVIFISNGSSFFHYGTKHESKKKRKVLGFQYILL